MKDGSAQFWLGLGVGVVASVIAAYVVRLLDWAVPVVWRGLVALASAPVTLGGIVLMLLALWSDYMLLCRLRRTPRSPVHAAA